jgi:putative flippase GtrA
MARARENSPSQFLAPLHALLEPRLQLMAYGAVSVAALCVDMAVYLSLAATGLVPVVAGIAGYLVGMVTHFALSTRLVFAGRGVHKSETRLLAEFALSGLIGVVLTSAVIFAGTGILGLPALPAKLAAIIISFGAVYLLRSRVVFAQA